MQTSSVKVRQSLDQRILRRTASIHALIFLVFVVVLGVLVQQNIRANIKRSAEVALFRLESAIEDPLTDAFNDLTTLTGNANVADYVTFQDEESREHLVPALLRQMDNVMRRNIATYQRLRIVGFDGDVFIEAINQGNGTQLIGTSDTVVDMSGLDPEDNLHIQQLEGSQLLITMPVPNIFGDSAAWMQLAVDQGLLVNALTEARSDALIDEFARNIFLINGDNDYITGTEFAAFNDEVKNVLAERPNDFVTHSLAFGRTISAAALTGPIGESGVNWRVVIVDDIGTFLVLNIFVVLMIVSVVVLLAMLLITQWNILRRMLAPMRLIVDKAYHLGTGESIENLERIRTGDELEALDNSLEAISASIQSQNAAFEASVNHLQNNINLVARIGRGISTRNEIDQLLRTAINLICEQFGYYHAQVFLVDDAHLNAVLAFSRGEAGQMLLARNHKIEIGSDSIVGYVTANGAPIIINNTIDRQGRPHRPNPLLPETRAEVGLPLMVHDRIIGALNIHSKSPDAFRDEDLPILSLLADQLAVAIYNAETALENERRIEQIGRLNRQITQEAWDQAESQHHLQRAYRYDLLNVNPLDGPPANTFDSVAIPITIRGEAIATLSASPTRGQEFTQGDYIVLNSVAERIALAIENARLFQETQATLQETSTLYRLSRALNAAGTLGEIVNAIIDVVMPEASGGQVWIFDEYFASQSPDWITLEADHAITERAENNQDLTGLRLHLPDHTFLSGLSQDQVTLINEARYDDRLDNGIKLICRRILAEAMVIIPLTVRGMWRGIITITFAEARQFSAQQGRIYTALIDQAGVAIDNRLLLQQTEEEVARNENLYAASRIVNTATNMQDLVFAAVATNQNAALEFSLSLLEGQLNEKGWPTRARMVAASNGGAVEEVDWVYSLKIPSDSPLYDHNPEVIVDDTPNNGQVSDWVRWIRERSHRFTAIFPLFSANQPIALFNITSTELYELSDNDYEVYRAMTGQMSSQIRIRRLLEQTEIALDETRRLYLASNAIAAAQDSAAVFEASLEHLARPFAQEISGLSLMISILLADPDPVSDAPFLNSVAAWSHGEGLELMQKGSRLIREDFPAGELTSRSSEVIYFPSARTPQTDPILRHHPRMSALLDENGIESAIIVPIRTRLNWFGAIVAYSDQVQTFTEQYQRFASAIAGQISIALDRQRLFETARFEAERAQVEARRALALAEAAQVANQIGEDFEEGLRGVFDRVAVAGGFDRWLLLQLDASAGRLYSITVHLPGYEDQHLEYTTNTTIPIVDAVRLRRRMTVNNPAEYPPLRDAEEVVRQHYVETFGKHVVVPVRSGVQVVGALLAGRGMADDDLDDRDEQLLETLATQVGIALENRHLFESVQTEQRTLSSILSTMPAGVLVLDPETLKPVIFNEQAQTYLGREIDLETPFSVEYYSLHRTGTELFYPEEELPILSVLRDGQPHSTDDVAVILDGFQTDLVVDAAPIVDADGNITAIVVAFQDISNLRSLENTLQENLRETVQLYEAQRQFSEAETLDDVLDAMLLQLVMQQPTDAHILMATESGLQVVRSLGEPLSNPEVFIEVLQAQEHTLIHDVLKAETSDTLREFCMQMEIRSLAITSVRAGIVERPDMWMLMISNVANEFTDSLESLMTQLGDIATTALDNRYLIQAQQTTVQEIQTLYSTTTNISRSRDLLQLTEVLREGLSSMSPDYFAGYLNSDAGMAGGEYIIFNVAVDDSNPVNFFDFLAVEYLPQRGLYIDDLQKTQEPDPVEKTLLEHGIRAIAAVNLRPKDMPSGYLVLAFRNPHPFRDSEMRYLSTLSDSASVIFNNIILFDQIQNALEETSILYQASRALSDASTPDQILEVVVNYLISSHINQVFIALLNTPSWDQAGAIVEVASSWSEDESVDLTGVALSADQFPAWGILSASQVVTIDDVYDEESDLDPMARIGIESLDARSLVVIPLRVASRAIGAIWLGSHEPHTHVDREIRTYQAFMEQASLSMEASYLLEQTERRARQLQTSAEVSRSAGQILDLEELLPRLVDLIKAAFSYDHVQIFLMDDLDEYAQLRASTGEPGRQLLAVQHKLAKGSGSVIGRVTALAQPQIALDTADADVVHQPNPYLPLTRSEMAVPLIIKGSVIGALDVQSNQPNAFTEDDVNILTTLAAQISVAIDNANLYEDAQEQAKNLGFLFDVTTAAASADTLQESLENVAVRLQDTLQSLSTTVYLPQTYLDAHDAVVHTLKPVAVAGAAQPLSEIEEIAEEDHDNLINVVRSSKQPFVVADLSKESRYLPIVSSAHSAVLLPLISAGDVIGLIVIEDSRTSAFDYDTLQLLLTMSGSLSAIVQSNLLLEQLTKTNEQLRELDRLKSDFLANMSHELRTPLNSIIGFSRVMLKGIDGPLTEMQEQDLTTIYNIGQHLLMLINDVLDQAKIAAGKLDIKVAYFEIKPLVDAVKSIGVGLVKDKEIDMLSEVASNLPKVYGDEFRTRQVLLNLVSNAAKFTADGSITIRAYQVPHPETGRPMVRLEVQDTGIGIAEKDLPLLFEAFRQIDSSLTRTQGGTGLGLPIAKSLVEMQGGEMIVQSEINAGSIFSFTIPTEPVVEDDPEDEPEAEVFEADGDTKRIPDYPDLKKEKTQEIRPTVEVKSITATGPSRQVMQQKREILLIEDDKNMVDQFRRSLQREGFNVQTADHAAYAEAMASNLRPNVIVMDVNFANGEGWNILERLKDRDDTFDIPIVVVTLESDSERAYRAGAYAFIQRPFLPEQLTEAVLKAEEDSNTERILIIDDEPEAIRLLTQLLNENGTYRVFSADNGVEGISLVARRRPDLIILDLRMPNMDGFAVLNELRSNPETAAIPVMIVTGEIDFKADEQAQLANIHVLRKSDISQEEYDQFISEVKDHLKFDGE